MNEAELDTIDGATFVNGLANDAHDAAEGGGTNGNHDGRTGIDNLGAMDKTFCPVHNNGLDRVFTQVGCNFEKALRMGGGGCRCRPGHCVDANSCKRKPGRRSTAEQEKK
jgi:hypothetical protein